MADKMADMTQDQADAQYECSHDRKMFALIITAVSIFIIPTRALVGYDCGGHSLNITTLSLIDIGKCEINDVEPENSKIYLQLLQLSEFDNADVIQCRVEVDRTIYYCGMHSHISVVHNGRREYIQELSREACKRMHETGNFDLGRNGVITGLKSNSTATRGLSLAGTAAMDGSCTGTQYSDPYGTWEGVVVQASVRITLKNFQAPIQRASNEITLPSGVRCKAQEGQCRDHNGEDTYWSTVPTDSCHFSQYDILYEGYANKLVPKPNQTLPVVYTITTQETTFALTKTTELAVCGYTLLRTEHPKLFILETKRGSTFKIRSRITINNLDIFAYVNSKFVYVEKYVRTQLTQLYRDLMEQKCALEKQVLLNALSLYSIAPDEMAYRIMKSPGYTAIAAGEVIHLIKCVPVECKLRQTDKCYNELPITHRNTSAFLLPGSRILTYQATPRACSELLPAMFKIHDVWYRLLPRPIESLAPPIIQPLTRPTWKYVSPSYLATSGIYTSEDLDRLRNHIMFPVEKPQMLETIARGAMGHEMPSGTISLMNFLDEKTLDKIAESAGARLWRGFVTFGSASAGVLAIFLLIRLAKLIVDTAIHGYALHTVYGWSLHLLGALWSSVTHLLLHLAGNGTRRHQRNVEHHPVELMPLSPPKPEDSPPGPSAPSPGKSESEIPKTLEYKELRSYLHANE